MASRHRVRAPCMQIIKTATVPAAACKRVNIKQFHDSKIRFPLMRRMARCGACLQSEASGTPAVLVLQIAHEVHAQRVLCASPHWCFMIGYGKCSSMQMHTDALIWGALICAGHRRGHTRRSSRPCAPTLPCTEPRALQCSVQRPNPKQGSGLGCCAVPLVPRRCGCIGWERAGMAAGGCGAGCQVWLIGFWALPSSGLDGCRGLRGVRGRSRADVPQGAGLGCQGSRLASESGLDADARAPRWYGRGSVRRCCSAECQGFW